MVVMHAAALTARPRPRNIRPPRSGVFVLSASVPLMSADDPSTVTELERPDGPRPHPYTEGVHAPMKTELTIEALNVTGAIPPTLNGRYLRIGPNPLTFAGSDHHWFFGEGMVHGLALKNGKALWYRNRWVRSLNVTETLGEPPAPGPRNGSEIVNTHIVAIDGRTWALSEAGAFPVELDETLGQQVHNAFDGTLEGAYSAHPHRDPGTGDMHAFT